MEFERADSGDEISVVRKVFHYADERSAGFSHGRAEVVCGAVIPATLETKGRSVRKHERNSCLPNV